MAKLIGKGFISDNKGMLDKDGYWSVYVILKETHYFDDGTEREEKIEVRAMDKDFQTAHEIAIRAATFQLRDEVYDRGFTSLIAAREATESDASNKIDPSTPIQ